MKRRSCLLLALVIVAYLSACADSARAQPYAFTLISETTGTSGPSVNAAGLVAFAGTPPGRLPGVYVGDGGGLTTLADVSDERFDTFTDAVINESGAVAFVASTLPDDHGGMAGDGLYVSSGGAIHTIAETGPLYTGIGGMVGFNDMGRIAFNAGTPTSPLNILTSNGSTLTTIADDEDVAGLANPKSINESGTVVFFANLIGGGDAILAGNGGPLMVIADTGGEFTDVGTASTINDNGMVAFNARRADGVHGVYRGDGSSQMLLADTTGTFGSFVNPLINNHNDVAFWAFFDGGGLGLFTGADPVQDRIIATGDTLLGATVVDLSFNTHNLSDNGFIAFWAELSDGRMGVFRAHPDLIPEPAAVSLMGLGALGWLGYARRGGHRGLSDDALRRSCLSHPPQNNQLVCCSLSPS